MTYVARVTIICPEAMMPDANQLALVLGQSTADVGTFSAATHEDAQGNRYSVVSTLARAAFLDGAEAELSAPAHAPGADLIAAGRAQAAISLRDLSAPGQVSPTALVAVVGPNAPGAVPDLSAMGLTEIGGVL